MLASIIAHGLASKGHFNTFLTRGLYDPRLLVNYIYPFQGVFADASVDKFIEYASYISEIQHLDYEKTYQRLMSNNLSPALLHDNQELFAHIVLTKNINFVYGDNFHLPYKRKCFEWCYKNLHWGKELIRSKHVMDYAYLLTDEQIIEVLHHNPKFIIHFSNLDAQKIHQIIDTYLYILCDEKVRIFYKNLCEVHASLKNKLFDKVIECVELISIELFEQEEIVLKKFCMGSLDRQVKQKELEEALSLCEARILSKLFRFKKTTQEEFKDKRNILDILQLHLNARLLKYNFDELDDIQRQQITRETLCIPHYYIYVCWLHKRCDIIYYLYYKVIFGLQTIRLPYINSIQFRLALPPIQNNGMRYEMYARCFINNRTDLIEFVGQLDKIDYHLLLLKIAELSNRDGFYDNGYRFNMTDETQFIIRQFLPPSKPKTLEDKCNITFLIRASVLEDEKPDRILADIQIRLLELGAFDILDRFTVLADDLWIRAVNSLNYYALKYLLGRGFRPIGNEDITGGQCYDLIRVA